MEAYRTKCQEPDCGHERSWVGFKTGIGKTPEQLAQMRRDQTVCVRCGGKVKTTADERGLVGAMDAQLEAEKSQEELIDFLSRTCNIDRTQVVDNALRLFAYAAQEISNGRAFGSIDTASRVYTEVHLPAFDNIRPLVATKVPLTH